MFKPRNTIILVLGLVLGCNFIPPELCTLDTITDPQSVQDVTTTNISDPNAPALNSPAAEGDPIRVRLSNPTNRDADCVVTMELIGREVHLSTRRIIASTDSLVIGPDRADTVRIEVTFLGEPAVVIVPTVLRINQDYQPGDTIEYVLELPADDSEQEQPDDDDQSSDDPPPPPPDDDEDEEDPTGACCLSGGPCEITTEADCIDGLWLGEDTTCEECPECLVICPADATDENEPCGEDTNGGCYSYPAQFTSIACDETVCATSWSDFADPNDPNSSHPNRLEEGLLFDTDWYELHFEETTEFTFTVATEFPIFVMLMKQYDPGYPGCENLTGDVAVMAYSAECGLVTLSRCVESGTYYILVHAAFEYLEGIYLSCEDQNHYTATLTCSPCDFVAACCFESDCVGDTTEADCLDQGGTWHYWGRCEDFVCPPINDECENAIQIGEVTDLAFDTSSATEGTYDECMYGPNIWYCYTATNTGPMVISLCGSNYDTMLAVYDGCNCSGEMSPIGCNDDTYECGLQSQIIIDAYADQTYMIEIGGYSNYSGSGILNIHPLPGACCVDNTCVATNTLSECNELGGTWYAGEDCGSFQCPPPCPESEITITIVTDGYPSEITWEIFDPNSMEPVCSGGPYEYANIPYTYTCCIGAEDCVDFTIYDSYGDGIEAPGGYSITLDGAVLYDCIGDGWGYGEGDYQETYWDIGGGCIFYGACCFGGGDCSIMTEDECTFYQGFYQGDYTSCDPNPCPQPPEGACCTWDGVCEFVTEAECNQMEGVYQGDDIPCDPDPCLPPFGACCTWDGVCEFVTEAECNQMEGVYQGDDIPCDPDPCLPPFGACCVGDGVCEMLTDMDCYKFGGEFMGDGVECDPNPCPIP